MVLVLLVVDWPAVAAADSPATLNVGLGVTEERWTDAQDLDGGSRGFAIDAALYVQGGPRVTPDLSIVIHGGISAPKILVDTKTEQLHYVPLELGLGVEYTFPYDIWASPWLGIQKIGTYGAAVTNNPIAFAFGGEAGVDFYNDNQGSRTGLFLTAEASKDFVAFGAGISYRFR
jgi:hypothetical protein